MRERERERGTKLLSKTKLNDHMVILSFFFNNPLFSAYITLWQLLFVKSSSGLGILGKTSIDQNERNVTKVSWGI